MKIVSSQTGVYWIGLLRDKLIRYTPSSGTKQGYFTYYAQENIFDGVMRFLDEKENIWMAKGPKLIRFSPDNDNGKGEIITFENDNPMYSRSFAQDKLGNIWFVGGNGIYMMNESNDFKFYDLTDHLLSTSCESVMIDQAENIWIGTQSRGLIKLEVLTEEIAPTSPHVSAKVTHYTISEGLKNNYVEVILEDSQGYLWVGTRGGLHRFKATGAYLEETLYYSKTDGLTHDHIRAITEDQNHKIWITTIKGLNVLIPQSQDALNRNQEKRDYHVHTFTKREGLKNIFFERRTSHLDGQNRLWWGTPSALTMLDLNKFKFPTEAPKNIDLSHITINQQFVDFRQLKDTTYHQPFDFTTSLSQSFDSVATFQNYPLNLKLPHDLNHLTFHFTAIDWYAPHKIQYQYKMEGLDKEWRTAVSEPQADYANLSSGNYTLRVKAKGAANVPSEEFTYKFRILPPWWLSWWAKAFYALNGIFLIYGLIRWRTVNLQQRQRELEQTVVDRTLEVVEEKKRSDELLLNILPASVAKELRETGKNQPVFFEEVSILFTDFKGFTNIVASIPGKKLVQELDEIFQAYDDIIEEVGLEKIQTVGDAYLAAGGVPESDPDHAEKCILAGKKIIAFLEKRNQIESIKWQVRVGIHSGPITAGVIGKKKFSYDLFGDSINIAARMESSSEAGKINISAYTHNLVKDKFPCTYRGKINAKGKGELDMYFVD